MTASHYRILAVCWTAAILIAYTIPTPNVGPETTLSLDKLAHFGMFLGFGFLWMHALHPRRDGRKAASWRRTGLLLTVGIGLSVLAEVYQDLLPRRAAEPYDAAANIFGLFVAVGIFWWRHPSTPSPSKQKR